MASLQHNLLRARLDLLNAQTNLALVRKHKTAPYHAHRMAESALFRALDRAWEAQCMAEGTFHA
jgi:hypothetical protein